MVRVHPGRGVAGMGNRVFASAVTSCASRREMGLSL